MVIEWWQPQKLPSLLFALGLLGVMAWVLLLDARSRLHRALALFLFLRGLRPLIVYLQHPQSLWLGNVLAYVALAIPFALIHLGFAYRDRYALKTPGAWALRIPGRGRWILGAAVAVEVLYFLRHDLFFGAEGAEPLRYLAELFTTIEVVVAFVFGVDYLGSSKGPCARALLFACVGFAFHPLFQAVFWGITDLAVLIGGDRGALDRPSFLLELGQVAVILSLVGVLAWRALTRLEGAPRTRLLAPLGIAVVLGLIRVTLEFAALQPYPYLYFSLSFDAIVGLTMPALLALAVARHHLLDLDFKVRVGLQSGTIGALLVSIFFMLSEGVPLALAQALGAFEPFRGWATALGVVGTAMLILFLHPVYRFAERLALKAVPTGHKPEAVAPPDRESIFFDQAQLAWMEGVLRAKDRRLLDSLRDRLGLSLAQAALLESEAVKNPGRQRFADLPMPRLRGRARKGLGY